MSEPAHRRSVLLLIDVEPDARQPKRGVAGGWEGTRASLELIEDLRRGLERRTEARVVLNWFLRIDPQIEETWGRADWVRNVVPELFELIAAREDYTGIHPHLWRWSAADRAWFNDLVDEAWLRCCLDTAVEGYRALFGRAPEACRFGDRWLSDAALRDLQRRGIRYDLSLEPGRPQERPPGDHRARGRLPDTHAAPRVPFLAGTAAGGPSHSTEGSEDSLWIVPLTTSRRRWQPTPNAPFLINASVSPNLALDPLLVASHLEEELERDTAVPLVLVLRSGDLARRRRRANFQRNVGRLLAHPDIARCELTTPPIAIRRWRLRAT